jgi:hydroxyethylthiazole kinase-like uncharacterized protein yjeF
MEGVWDVAQIRAAEQRVMAGLPPGALMAHAARAIAVESAALLGFSYGARVLLLVGSGDNGGDALFAGAELAGRGGTVYAVLADEAKAHADGLMAFRRAGGRVVVVGGVPAVDLIIDGLVGIGASGRLRDSVTPLVDLAEHSSAPVVAVDIPSGVDPNTGAVEGKAVTADLTVCMGALKAGLVVGDGLVHAGRITVVDIGIGVALPQPEIWRLTDADVATLLPRPRPQDNKYSRGVVGVAAGSATYPGAARLAVGSARLGGVGAVRYAGHAAAAVSDRYPEVLVTPTVEQAGRTQAWVVGPGLGDSTEARRTLEQVLAHDVPVLVDADGLNLLVGRHELIAKRSAPTVITPHDGEFARHFGQVGPDRIGAARRAARGIGATVLLKGYATIVAEPNGRVFVNAAGSPALATAGSGDVLSGLAGSLIAAGIQPALAAATAAHLHGLAGAHAERSGPVTAGDLVSAIRAVIGLLQQS